MDLNTKTALIDWRKADLKARVAELDLRHSAFQFEQDGISHVPQALIESAATLRQVACDILLLLMRGDRVGLAP